MDNRKKPCKAALKEEEKEEENNENQVEEKIGLKKVTSFWKKTKTGDSKKKKELLPFMDVPHGIKNNGVVCYANAVLQSWISTRAFVAYLNEHETETRLGKLLHSLYKQYTNFIFRLPVSEITSSLGFKSKPQDPGDFHRKLIEIYVDNDLFTVHKMVTLHCECGRQSSNIEDMFCYNLHLDRNACSTPSLMDLIHMDLKSWQTVDAVCEKCQNVGQKWQTQLIFPLPKILTFAFLQYHFVENQMKKIGSQIILPQKLTLDSFIDGVEPTANGTYNYSLKSTIYHHNSLPKSGHYIAQIMRDKDVYLCDDVHVTKTWRIPSTFYQYMAYYELDEEAK